MHRSVTTRCCRLALKSAAALVLTIAPYQIVLDGSVSGIHTVSAYAKGGGNSGGGGGGGNSGGGNGGNSGGSNSGNSGNGNGNNGNSGNSGNNGKSGSNQGKSGSHVNAKTGDKVDVTGNKITVRHPDGITEKLENGRFSMKDALGRTIIDRQATPADANRLKAL
ncbi:hypothetical protein [Mesorhizobium ciceri]|uniref:Glycine-rich cell wall protein n=1 Tax=Mesorhizobium ciceri biovar biserrulae (strain HAMBI 2942 / LMG 23838 / WSM1271) TaxID=765698 RepID=E8TGP4_MESCW|nr:hypothetical protein [Mesorhizobium ciceri]ADV09980.1 glycine-rich cell wall protein [Mesorhizobium ciceri biovar biserrulae WSM1271]